MGFTLITDDVAYSKQSLTTTQKKALTDLFIKDVDVSTAKIKLGIPRNLIKHSYAKKAAIFSKVQELMTNGYLYSEEVSHIDETTGEKVIDKEVVIRQVGAITTLKTQTKKFFPDCEKESFDYNIDMIVKWHDGKGEGVWENFLLHFKEAL